eukprot:6292739-Amphidinium_carterae.1
MKPVKTSSTAPRAPSNLLPEITFNPKGQAAMRPFRESVWVTDTLACGNGRAILSTQQLRQRSLCRSAYRTCSGALAGNRKPFLSRPPTIRSSTVTLTSKPMRWSLHEVLVTGGAQHSARMSRGELHTTLAEKKEQQLRTVSLFLPALFLRGPFST